MKSPSTSIPGRKKRCPNCDQEYSPSEVICSRDGFVLAPIPIKDLVGSTLAKKYEIISKIGSGGMSIIYKARDQALDRIVAVKVLQSQLIDDETSMKRFKQEAQAASHLSHQNIIGIHDFDVSDIGQPYLVMDFLSGESLSDIVKREGQAGYSRLIPVFMQTCDALEHAHNKGVIHRDLKSSNVMLSTINDIADIVTVVDFGIAKLMPSSGKQPQNLTNTGEIFGSPIYMSPEQCLGQALDFRSDIYSLGTMMYETLTGLPPLMGDTIVETMKMHVNTKPRKFKEVRPDLDIPPGLETIVFKALEKSPNDRFQTMRQCYEALEHLQSAIGRSSGGGVMKTSSAQRALSKNVLRQSSSETPLKKDKPLKGDSGISAASSSSETAPVPSLPFPEPRKTPNSLKLRQLTKPNYRMPTRLTIILLAIFVLVICITSFMLLVRH